MPNRAPESSGGTERRHSKACEEGSGKVLRKGLSSFFGGLWSGAGPAYTGGVATISSGRRPFPPGRILLTLAGWLPFPQSGDHWRPFPFWLSLLTLVGGGRISPFRSYIILYVNGDGVGTPHCTGAPVPNGPFLFPSSGSSLPLQP